ncbi:hypothetical protein BDR22DRAFT_434885 [Usnea florida]
MTQTAMEDLESVFDLLTVHDVSACLIGELALNYYNVPRVVHDFEIAVRQDDLNRAARLLKSEPELFEAADEDTFNIYTEYKRGLPRFRFRNSSTAYLVLLPDTSSNSRGVVDRVVPQSLHQQDSEYSFELLDLIPKNRIPSLPVPFLGPLLSDYSRKYIASQDAIAAMAIDGLIDGMDLDDLWCERNLIDLELPGLEYVHSRVRGRVSRIDYFSPNTVTCIILDDDERQRLFRVPGREFYSSSRNKPWQSLLESLRNMRAEVSNIGWMASAHQFVESQKHNLPHSL